MDGGPEGSCDPVQPGFNGSAWHAANGTINATGALSVVYDSARGTADPPMLGEYDGATISWYAMPERPKDLDATARSCVSLSQ